MAASFPTSIKSFTTKTAGAGILSEHVNDLQNEVVAIETQLGVKAGEWQDWTPTQTGWTALPAGTYKCCFIGKTCFIAINQTAGTSNATSARLTLPVNIKAGQYYGGVNALCVDNNVVLTVPTKYYITPATHTIEFSTDMGTGVFTASGTKRIRVTAFYEVE